MGNNPLIELIDEGKRRNGWSDEQVAQRARDKGHTGLSKSNISRIRTDPYITIVPAVLKAVSDAMHIPLEALTQAALATAGLPGSMPNTWDADAAIQMDPTIDVATKEAVLEIVRRARDRTKDNAPARRRRGTSTRTPSQSGGLDRLDRAALSNDQEP